jgi:retron-type reverse transcriptase
MVGDIIMMQNHSRKLLKNAFRIICRNYACPGNDGVSISQIKKKYKYYEDSIFGKLECGNFEFQSKPKSVLIQDYLGKNREIFVYTVEERWVQEYLKLCIEAEIENMLVEYTFAFRRKKSDIDSYSYILRSNPKYILRIDIKNFFFSINREKIFIDLGNTKIPIAILALVKKSFDHCLSGLPQGHVLSCILANYCLSNFDKMFPTGYTRFSDDMMFSCDSQEKIESTLLLARALLKEQGFELNEAKTRIVIKPTFEKIL